MDMLNQPPRRTCPSIDMAEESNSNEGGTKFRLTGSNDKRAAAVHAEMERVNNLPANSSYAQHRMRVLNKLFHLLSIQRTTSQDEELELLFAGLSL